MSVLTGVDATREAAEARRVGAKLPDPTGAKAVVRSASDIKNLCNKKERALNVWQTRRIETVLLKWDLVPGDLGIVEEEERDRSVIGLTASNKCLVLANMVDNAMREMGGAVSEDAAIQSLLTKGTYMQGWHPGCHVTYSVHGTYHVKCHSDSQNMSSCYHVMLFFGLQLSCYHVHASMSC
ncbi:unnamed protein product [Durusdinium trenchii]|uniref:Uncharacterized protein n=1 Tax=Durusdinium trenchii TaxID=1381693 RepID=A0ABP0K397_9DINO